LTVEVNRRDEDGEWKSEEVLEVAGASADDRKVHREEARDDHEISKNEEYIWDLHIDIMIADDRKVHREEARDDHEISKNEEYIWDLHIDIMIEHSVSHYPDSD
jgi:ribose 5-phosphate isomerase